MDPIKKYPQYMLALIYQHQPDPSWVYKLAGYLYDLDTTACFFGIEGNRGTVVSNIELQSAGDESLNLAVWTMLSKQNSVHHVSLVGASEHSWIKTFHILWE